MYPCDLFLHSKMSTEFVSVQSVLFVRLKDRTGKAMNDHNITWVLFEKLEHVFAYLECEDQGRGVMIFLNDC